jgi:hypothetical protein
VLRDLGGNAPTADGRTLGQVITQSLATCRAGKDDHIVECVIAANDAYAVGDCVGIAVVRPGDNITR